jgi:hypothetical protein
MSFEKGIRQRARIAMGGGMTPQSYARGGKVGIGGTSLDVAKPVKVSTAAAPLSPLTMARRNNGVVGMKKGGKVCGG